jgi:hypothetical protein
LGILAQDAKSVKLQYMVSLHAKAGKKSSKAVVVTKGKKKPVVLDLDHKEDEEDEGDDGTMEKEKKFLEQLQRALGGCQLCGPSKLCKINRNGEHINLTFNQLHRWAIALVKSLNH